jgi:hypothetical protein
MPDRATGNGRGGDGHARDSSAQGVRDTVIRLIIDLQRLAGSGMPLQRRIDLLRGAEPKVLWIVHSLPKPVAEARRLDRGRGGKALTLEQRIYGLMAENLRFALTELDRSVKAFGEGASEDRRWLVRHLFLFLAKQLEYSLVWGRAWVRGNWRELHDLYLYLANRPDIKLGSDRSLVDAPFDPEAEYKRLLLIGLLKPRVEREERLSRVLRQLPLWAMQSALSAPSADGGVGRIYAVEAARDQPPTESSRAFELGFHGWILAPCDDFVAYLGG